jgi:hypothetical protein
MKEKIMYIKTVYDLIEYSKNHPNYEYTYYDGDWIVYDDKDNLIDEKEVKLNSIMMRQLADMNVISFKGYVISHRAVRRYCVDENFEEKIAIIKKMLTDIIVTVKDVKIKSLKHISQIFEDRYKIFADTETEEGSYWGGCYEVRKLHFCNDLKFWGSKVVWEYTYYVAGNCLGSKFYKNMINLYSQVFGGWDVSSKNYKRYIDDKHNSFVTDDEWFKLRDEAFEKSYIECLEYVKGHKNDTND